ncbi:MAG TPA: DUF971 domain-containing protein [Nitrososphaerales archaeon]|nr:DUF971 domain-containing protein [Nitrososphaerales archaeon]
MEPVALNVSQRDGKETIFLLWSDGHRSSYEVLQLRGACPCAMCQGEPGIFGKKYEPLKDKVQANVVPQEIEPVGRYGIKIRWSDGHNLGIYTFEYLRKLCPCEVCQKTRS